MRSHRGTPSATVLTSVWGEIVRNMWPSVGGWAAWGEAWRRAVVKIRKVLAKGLECWCLWLVGSVLGYILMVCWHLCVAGVAVRRERESSPAGFCVFCCSLFPPLLILSLSFLFIGGVNTSIAGYKGLRGEIKTSVRYEIMIIFRLDFAISLSNYKYNDTGTFAHTIRNRIASSLNTVAVKCVTQTFRDFFLYFSCDNSYA